jgi:hypothetical protein
MAFNLGLLNPLSMGATLAHRRLQELVETSRRQGIALDMAQIQPLLDRGAMASPGESRLKGDRDFLEFLFGHLPRERFVELVGAVNASMGPTVRAWLLSTSTRRDEVRAWFEAGVDLSATAPGTTQGPDHNLGLLFQWVPREAFSSVMAGLDDPSRKRVLGWMIDEAQTSEEVEALLLQGAVVTMDVPGVDPFTALLRLSRFEATTPFFLEHLSRFPEWVHMNVQNFRERETHVPEWLLQHACPMAFSRVMDQGLDPFSLFHLRTTDVYGNARRLSDPEYAEDRPKGTESLLQFALRTLTQDNLDEERETALLAKAIALFERGATQTHSGTAREQDHDGFNILGGKPRQTTPQQSFPRASNRVIEALYPHFLKDTLEIKLQSLLTDRHFKALIPVEEGSGKTRLNPAIEDLFQQGARAFAQPASDLDHGGRLSAIVELAGKVGRHPDAEFERVFDTYVPDPAKPRVLVAMLSRLFDYYPSHALDRYHAAVRWVIGKGVDLDAKDGPGMEESFKFTLAKKMPDLFSELLANGRIDLDQPTYEGRAGKGNHAPLGVQIARLLGPEALYMILASGWDADRVFECEQQHLTLAQIVAQQVERKVRRDEAIMTAWAKAQDKLILGRNYDYEVFLASRTDQKMELLHQSGVDFSRTGPSNSSGPAEILHKAHKDDPWQDNPMAPLMEKMVVWKEQSQLNARIATVPESRPETEEHCPPRPAKVYL